MCILRWGRQRTVTRIVDFRGIVGVHDHETPIRSAGTGCSLLLPGDGRANHDRLPDPPPQSTNQKLPSLPNLGSRSRHSLRSVLWRGSSRTSSTSPSPASSKAQASSRAGRMAASRPSRTHGCPSGRRSGPGLGGSGGLHPLLWRPLLWPSSLATRGRGFPQDHQRGGRPGSDRRPFQSRRQPGLAVPRQERCPCPAPGHGNP